MSYGNKGECRGGIFFCWVDLLLESVPVLTFVEVIVQKLMVLNKLWLYDPLFFDLAWRELGAGIFGIDQDWRVDGKLLIEI